MTAARRVSAETVKNNLQHEMFFDMLEWPTPAVVWRQQHTCDDESRCLLARYLKSRSRAWPEVRVSLPTVSRRQMRVCARRRAVPTRRNRNSDRFDGLRHGPLYHRAFRGGALRRALIGRIMHRLGLRERTRPSALRVVQVLAERAFGAAGSRSPWRKRPPYWWRSCALPAWCATRTGRPRRSWCPESQDLLPARRKEEIPTRPLRKYRSRPRPASPQLTRPTGAPAFM